jgi:hypothetical protein
VDDVPAGCHVSLSLNPAKPRRRAAATLLYGAD